MKHVTGATGMFVGLRSDRIRSSVMNARLRSGVSLLRLQLGHMKSRSFYVGAKRMYQAGASVRLITQWDQLGCADLSGQLRVRAWNDKGEMWTAS